MHVLKVVHLSTTSVAQMYSAMSAIIGSNTSELAHTGKEGCWAVADLS